MLVLRSWLVICERLGFGQEANHGVAVEAKYASSGRVRIRVGSQVRPLDLVDMS
jgi:hypothetical protein